MPTRTPRRTIAATVAAIALLLATIVPAGAADPVKPAARGDISLVKNLTPSSRVTGSKSTSSRLAQSDRTLVARTDSRSVNVVIKLDFDAVASYGGGIDGLKATSPRVTGKPLDKTSSAEKAYRSFIGTREDAFVRSLKALVPRSVIGSRLETVYGGIAAAVPANSVKAILKLPGVVAVQSDVLEHPLTDASSTFIDADPVYADLGTTANAGQGIIFGSLDTGVWPEHPSFEDQGNLSAPTGPARACDFGIDPLTSDPFTCNNKLIGGQPFLTTYLSDPTRASGETFTSARDSDGHGTHTSSTVAGDIVAHAPVLGVDRGPIHGMAPGAWVMVYKVCGITGCYSSDSAAAVGQAIYDGVDVINFSISGGTDPMTDPVELAFLDAYNAGVVVSASAGNDGPTAGTVNHLSPWTISVAASTQTRAFESTLTLTDGATSATFTGASITAGISAPTPIVFASAAPYNDAKCVNPATAGIFTGKIVACERGTNARVDKGYDVLQGGAAGMVLYNPILADTETDNHWLPTVHLADGTAFVAFLTAHPTATATFTAGTKVNGQGDVMAAFSSRGPGGNFIKPDVTAPGVEILAGDTPVRDATDGGPAGEYYQAIAGTSMASPHVAGAAILVRAEHPYWTPGQVKSALMGTAVTTVKKEDLTTPADPFDFGSGRIDVAAAAAAPLTFDETAADFYEMTTDAVHAIDLNIPSIDATVMPGRITTTRVAKNPTNKTLTYSVATTAPAHSTITVSPSKFTLAPGKSVTLTVTIESTATIGTQQFGAIKIVTTVGVGSAAQIRRIHLPVAFIHTQADVALTQTCSPSSIVKTHTSLCTVTATNDGFTPQAVSLETRTSGNLRIVGTSGVTKIDSHTARKGSTVLEGGQPGVPSLSPLGFDGYFSLDNLGTPHTPIGDEDILNFPVPSFLYGGVTYDTLGVDSNGYIIVGGGTSQDDECCNLPSGPSSTRPNNILAPFWTDLDGTGADGILADVVSDGTDSWIVIEYRVNVFGTSDLQTFQIWIGINGTEDISYAYGTLPTDPAQPFLVGAENPLGQGEMSATLPTEDLVVTSSAPTPGGSLHYKIRVRGTSVGGGLVKTEMTASETAGVTIARTSITVRKK